MQIWYNGFTSLPPALDAATALVSLSLSCSKLGLTTTDVERLLASMPSLRRLECRVLPGVSEHLHETAPHLKLNRGWN